MSISGWEQADDDDESKTSLRVKEMEIDFCVVTIETEEEQYQIDSQEARDSKQMSDTGLTNYW